MESTIVKAKDIGIETKYVGFYGNKRRAVGDEFPLDRPNHFSGTWMIYVSGPKPQVVIEREEEAREEDERIADMRARQASGEGAPVKIVLNDNEIEGNKTPNEATESTGSKAPKTKKKAVKKAVK
jgi:hypothetical protein